MGYTKRALLIGSDYGGLKGTENDVETVAKILHDCDFQSENIQLLIGDRAIRDGILKAWEDLIEALEENKDENAHDTVVIYYSGHGGYATPDPRCDLPNAPAHFQFLLPSDFISPPGEWKGITDVEISNLLSRTAIIAADVTYILDCCHSARLGRFPAPVRKGWPEPVAKTYPLPLESTYYAKIWEVLALQLGSALVAELSGEDYVTPNVVRVAAAADDKMAFQHMVSEDRWEGMFTQYLAKVLPILGKETCWHNILLIIETALKERFQTDPQQPRVAGPGYRKPFSKGSDWSRALVAEIIGRDVDYDGDRTQIQGGRVIGVERDDLFSLYVVQLGEEDKSQEQPEQRVHTVKIMNVSGFASTAELTIPYVPDQRELALAFPQRRGHRWPFVTQGDVGPISWDVSHAAAFRPASQMEKSRVEFRQENASQVVLYGRHGDADTFVRLGSRDRLASQRDLNELLLLADMFARSQHIVSLAGVDPPERSERFTPNVDIIIGRGLDCRELILELRDDCSPTPPLLELIDGQFISFEFHLRGRTDLWVTVLSVDAFGKIVIASSNAWERGIPLNTEIRTRRLKRSTASERGIKISWPTPLPKSTTSESVYEYFVFVITGRPVDLRFLESSDTLDEIPRETRGVREKSLLEMARKFTFEVDIPYCITAQRYLLKPA
ncbi:hypothetical protein DL98DRAFT_577809 [Cadophora sp. DSE1049]|nr:hypothetical protein DL98DRAFT_577809 [Cadophora sp. DSE1049]